MLLGGECAARTDCRGTGSVLSCFFSLSQLQWKSCEACLPLRNQPSYAFSLRVVFAEKHLLVMYGNYLFLITSSPRRTLTCQCQDLVDSEIKAATGLLAIIRTCGTLKCADAD